MAANYVVPGMTLIPQQLKMSCWYASAQMLIKWKMDKTLSCMQEIVPAELDAECIKIRDDNNGIANQQILNMAKRLGLRPIPPVCPSTEALDGWLRKYGPLWVNGKTHIVVIAGISNENLKVYDPSPVGAGRIDWRSISDWYEGSSSSSRDTSASVETVFLHCP